jgi:hypothetical protein
VDSARRHGSRAAVFGLIGLTACVDDRIDPTEGTAGTETGISDLSGDNCALDMYDPNDSPEAATPIDATTTQTATLCALGDEADW